MINSGKLCLLLFSPLFFIYSYTFHTYPEMRAAFWPLGWVMGGPLICIGSCHPLFFVHVRTCHTCTHTYVHAHTHTRAHAHTNRCSLSYTYIHSCMYMSMHMHTSTYTSLVYDMHTAVLCLLPIVFHDSIIASLMHFAETIHMSCVTVAMHACIFTVYS